MENSKNTTMTEKSLNINASNDLELYIQEGESQGNVVNNIAREQELREFYKGILQSPLRKARYQFMKDHLQCKGGYILKKRGPRSFNEFESWTSQQIEQALDDVILCGYGEVFSYQRGGGIFIKFFNKEKKLKGSART